MKIGVSLAMATQPFRDPLRDPNHPQNPHLDTLGNFFGIEKWFLAILRIIVSFLECKNAKNILRIIVSFLECKNAKNFQCRFTNEDCLK